MKVVLASSSRQRKLLMGELAKEMGFEWEAKEVVVEEVKEGNPEEVVVENAFRKLRKAKGDVVVAGDTIAYKERILFKPSTIEEAKEMLREISGGWVEVFNATAVKGRGYELSTLDYAKVKIKPWEALEGVEREERLGKAGAFSLDDVEVIVGSPHVVLGLNTQFLREVLRAIEKRV